MQVPFRKSALHLLPEDIVTASVPPFPQFAVPAFVKDFYQTLVKNEATNGRTVEGGFAFGGMFADARAGRKPADHDVYVAVPQLIAALQENAARPYDNLNEYEDICIDAERLLGHAFPIKHIAGASLKPIESSVLGPYFAMQGFFSSEHGEGTFDAIFGTKNLKPQDFLPFFHAPIMAAGATLGGETQYVYHRDFPDHAERQIMQVASPVPQRLREKAKRKGMTIEEVLPPAVT